MYNIHNSICTTLYLRTESYEIILELKYHKKDVRLGCDLRVKCSVIIFVNSENWQIDAIIDPFYVVY